MKNHQSPITNYQFRLSVTNVFFYSALFIYALLDYIYIIIYIADGCI